MEPRKAYRSRDGFTVIEILLILAIIGILAAIIIPQVFYRSTDAANKSAKDALRAAMTAQEVYYLDHSSYTNDILALKDGYDLIVSDKVVLSIVKSDEGQYKMEAYHIDGDRTYAVDGPDGEIYLKEEEGH